MAFPPQCPRPTDLFSHLVHGNGEVGLPFFQISLHSTKLGLEGCVGLLQGGSSRIGLSNLPKLLHKRTTVSLLRLHNLFL